MSKIGKKYYYSKRPSIKIEGGNLTYLDLKEQRNWL